MNTKFFFLFLVCMLLSSASSSIASSKKSHDFSTHNTQTEEMVVPVKSPVHSNKNAVPIDWEANHQKSRSAHQHPEEDGKHHHIHFHRLTHKGRRKFLFLAIAKFILIVMHLSFLVYSFILSMHF